jgi:hypothetical protein
MSLHSKQPRTFHPQLIDHIAAEVFWGYCHQTGYQIAIDCVLAGDFGKLWTLKKASKLARQYGAGMSHEEVKRFYSDINRYMMDHASRRKNIIGTLYSEDFAGCRPPEFSHEELLRRLRAGGDEAEGGVSGPVDIAGDLLIRTPLPSVLLLRDRPQAQWIQVGDTRKALGFQKIMVLLIHHVTTLPANPQGYAYGADGVFQIPCPDATGPDWFRLMPNSTACRRLALF